MFLFSILIASQCEMVINLARGLNMGNMKAIKMSDIENDCCNTTLTKVTCQNNPVKSVTHIEWGHDNLQLDGFINGSAIPPQLVLFNVHVNRIKGEMPVFPDSLRYLFLFGNNFNGTITRFPSEGYDIRLQNNFFTGTIPIITSKIVLLYLNNNLLTGTLPTLPLYDFDVSLNLLTGNLPNLTNMGKGYFTGNFLGGPLPYIKPSIVLLHLGSRTYGSNKFSGELSLTKPIEVLLFNNSIRRIEILNSSALTSCDIGYNPISYQNALLYPMCSRQGIVEEFTTFTESTTESTIEYTTESAIEYTAQEYDMTVEISSSLESEAATADLTTKRTNSATKHSTTSNTPLKTRIPLLRQSTSSNSVISTINATIDSTLQFVTSYSMTSMTVELLNINSNAVIYKVTLSTSFSVMRMTINTIFLLYLISKIIMRSNKGSKRKTDKVTEFDL